MNNKEINPAVAIAVGVVALLLIGVLGYKLFLAPKPLPPDTSAANYPGGVAKH